MFCSCLVLEDWNYPYYLHHNIETKTDVKVLEDWNYPYYLHGLRCSDHRPAVLEDWNYPYYLHFPAGIPYAREVLEDWNYPYYLHKISRCDHREWFLRIGIIRIICTETPEKKSKYGS